MGKNPLLTICITAYNSEKTIKKTLESVLGQTYENFEILVSDNGSSDTTLDIVKSFNSPKITIRHNIKKIKTDKPYIGSYDNYNGCIESGLIKGEFVAFYHADDIYEKNIAQKEVEFLTQNPEAGAVFASGTMINEKDKMIGKHYIPKELCSNTACGFHEVFNHILMYGNIFLLTPTFMARKDIFREVGLFASEGEFGTSADLEMWLRILKKYPIGILKERLIRRRIGGGGRSYNSLRTKEADYFKVMDCYLRLEHAVKIQKKFLEQYAYQKDCDHTIRAMNLLINNQTAEAKQMINASFSWNFFRPFFKNMNILGAKIMTLKILLFIGINLGLGRYLGKILYFITF